MLRQVVKATTRRHAPRYLRPQMAACLLSTAPKPSQGNQVSMSYQEWAAQNLAKNALRKTAPQAKQPQGSHPTRRIRPSKYKSLVYFPERVTLKFPNTRFELDCVEFSIAQPGKGGHVVLGRNGSGKSLLVQTLTQAKLQANNDDGDWKLPAPHQIAHVSFDSHLKILQEHPNRTVHDSITGGSGNLSKAAQYLVVRFGLFPILHRTLSTLSTGEIRKALVVSALAQQPKLLVLENAFDGLDVQSRAELKSIVSKTIQGLEQSGKLLVQHVNAEYVPPAQVLLSTHRPEEIVDEIETVSYIEQQPKTSQNTLMTMTRPSDYSQEQLLYQALGLDKNYNKNTQNWSVVAPWEDPDPTLPSIQDMERVWPASDAPCSALLSLDNVQIRRRRDGIATKEEEEQDKEFATLLHPLTWTIEPGQRWLIAGGNGAGKSTLSRFLLQSNKDETDARSSSIRNGTTTTTQDLTSGVYQKDKDTTIGWVSTESHLGQYQEDSATSAWDIIGQNGTISESVVKTMVQWVFGEDAIASLLKTRSLQQLSQGEQKMVLISAALAKQPKLLILDEPTQGLDWVNRRRILALLERLCQANPELSLVFITHYEEEWIPSISHVLHLDKGRALYQGEKKEYNPRKL